MIEAYNKKIKEIPLNLDVLDIPSTPDNPFEIDVTTVNRLKTQYYTY